jgi:translation initiation factor IF-1
MVKNTTGGSKTKGQARKLVSYDAKSTHKALRLSTDDYEIYSQVIKNLGNGMCHVLSTDGKTRLCHIRGKFRGRGKRDNMIVVGSWILVGLREWEVGKDDSKKLENCDLLEVYSDLDKERLKTTVTTVNWTTFVSNDTKTTSSKSEINTDNIDFSDNLDDYTFLMEETIKTGQKIEKIKLDDEEEIDINDI